jgi:DNA-binding protein, YbaB/EbfC family
MKSRLPQGYGGGPGNMNNMIKQAQKMQDQMEEVTKELEEKEYSALAGGGAVNITVTGKMQVKTCEIKPEVVDPEDIEMLSDLIIAATNEALKKAEDDKNNRMEGISGGISMPGLF